jgi:hypothetical protein
MMDFKQFGRKWPWHNLRYCPTFAWKLRKTTKKSVRIAGHGAEI